MISIVMEQQKKNIPQATKKATDQKVAKPVQTSVAGQNKQSIKKISEPATTGEGISRRANIGRIYKADAPSIKLGLRPGPRVTG